MQKSIRLKRKSQFKQCPYKQQDNQCKIQHIQSITFGRFYFEILRLFLYVIIGIKQKHIFGLGMLLKFLFKQFFKLLTFHVKSPAFASMRFSYKIIIIQSSHSMLFTGHKRNCGNNHRANIPSCCPRLLMKVSETCADWLSCLKTTAGSIKQQSRRGERVFFAQLQNCMIKAIFIYSIKTEYQKMKMQYTFTNYNNVGYRILLQLPLLFLKPHQSQFLTCHFIKLGNYYEVFLKSKYVIGQFLNMHNNFILSYLIQYQQNIIFAADVINFGKQNELICEQLQWKNIFF